MDKKYIFNKLKSQKGLTGADVAIAISILIAAAVIVTMIYTNLNSENKSVTRNAGATRLATNILANMELNDYDDVKSEEIKNGEISEYYNTRVPNGYYVIVSVEENNTKDIFKMVKNVTVEVKYTVSGQEESVKVSTTIEKKYYDECNRPNLSENFLVNSDDAETKQLGSQKSFIPIKYSYITDNYIVTTENDNEWYNYSSREWAKILAFSEEEVKKKFVDSNGNIVTDVVTIDGVEKKFTDYLYVWIPNFGKSEDITLEDGTVEEGEYYFRLGNKSTAKDKNALVLTKTDKIEKTNETDGIQTVEEIILNAYEIDDSITFKDSTGDAVVMKGEGYWRLYEETPSSAVYESLSESRFGPMILY